MKFYSWLLFMAFLCVMMPNKTLYGQTGAVNAENLRCENLTDPLAVDSITPRLSWTLASAQRGQYQTAYRILVASSNELLEQNIGDRWDTGKVLNEETIGIKYAGLTLATGDNCFWKVKVWDAAGLESDWSEISLWKTGMLSSTDWTGQWIGYDTQDSEVATPGCLQSAHWIWNDSNAATEAEAGTVYFRTSFELTSLDTLKQADCYITADNTFTLYINGVLVASRSILAVVNKYSIDKFLAAGTNSICVIAENDSDPAGLICAVDLEGVGGGHKYILSNSSWKCSETAYEGWKRQDYDDTYWSNSSDLGIFGMSPWQGTSIEKLPPVRYLRKEFELADKTVKKAYISATSLGFYQLSVNGQEIADEYFSPGWTDYNIRISYRTYDITDKLNGRELAVGAILADGWYAGYVAFDNIRNRYGKQLRLLCQLRIEYDDGSVETFDSSDSWKASQGPTRYGDLLKGECYDARMEMPGWNEIGYDDSDWTAVSSGLPEVQPALIEAAVSQPVRVYDEITPIEITEPSAGTYIFNLGQNMAGFVRLKIAGNAGQRIMIRYAERLNNDGTIYIRNLRTATATDKYICKGGGLEEWHPSFTFHGFQYVEVTGLTAKPELNMITGMPLSSDTPVVGHFECSDAMVNKIQKNSYWTQRMNFIDIPTDCPQRDERLGWTGDAQVYINTACYHTDVQPFFTKWITDLNDAQRSDGQYPKVAPLQGVDADGGPAWADSGIICPWTIYKMYGDKEILEQYYANMKNFIIFCRDRSTSDLLPPSSYHCYGDWLNISDDTPNDVIYMAYFGYSTQLLSQIAYAIGKASDGAAISNLFSRIKTAFNANYVNADGSIYGDSQAAYVMALAYDMLNDEYIEPAANHLIRNIRESGWHLSTGFVGTKDLMLALAKIGRNDIAYELLHNDTYPSWGYSIKYGATSIWERWNGWTPENGFEDPGMNSFAHYSFGAVCQWIFENIGGIQPGTAGFKHIIIRPEPDMTVRNTINWADTSYESVRGMIKTSWKYDGANYSCDIEIPAGTTATAYIPADYPESVSESGVAAADADGVIYTDFDNGLAQYELFSGIYHFTSRKSWTVLKWAEDAETAISTGKIYTHAVNLNNGDSGTTVINGVAFENDGNRTGLNWVLNGAGWSHSQTASGVDGDSAELIEEFYYSEPAELVLSGLTPGIEYLFTQYCRGYGDPDGRIVTLTSSVDNCNVAIDQNYYGDQQGIITRYRYLAPESGQLKITYNAENSADVWHHYAFSNELYNDYFITPDVLNGALYDSYYPLSWVVNNSPDGAQYRIKVSLSPEMSDPIIDIITGQDSYKPELEFNTAYYWAIELVNEGELLYTSPVWNFTTTDEPVLAGKVLEWKLDESDGTTASQSGSYSGGNGSLAGFNELELSRTAGVENNAILFNGADEYINISSAAAGFSSVIQNDMTISAYICTKKEYGPILSVRNSTDENPILAVTVGYDGANTSAGSICILARDNNYNLSSIVSDRTVNDGKFHSILIVKNDTGWILYIDGIYSGEMAIASSSFTFNMAAIGTSLRWIQDDEFDTGYRYFEGIIDEVCVYSAALHTSQLDELVNLLPADEDLNRDHNIDIDDLSMFCNNWLECIPYEMQSDVILEDMESYVEKPEFLSEYWPYVSENGYGELVLTITGNSTTNFMKIDYNFNGNQICRLPFILNDRRIDLSRYNRLILLAGLSKNSTLAGLNIDLYDGRYNQNPLNEGLLAKGAVDYDFSEIMSGKWLEFTYELPDNISTNTCKDLYKIVFNLEKITGAETGSLYIDTIKLIDLDFDSSVPVGSFNADIDQNNAVDLADFSELARMWLVAL